MANKKISETIKQQRKYRESFLELKKMQSGEIKPESNAEKHYEPKTFGEKVHNYWYFYKWQVIFTLFVIISLAVLLTQCARRKNYDLKVIYFTYTPVVDEQTDLIGKYLETVADDVNGDGKVNIQVINCSIMPTAGNGQYTSDTLSKMTSIIAVDEKVMLFITDSDSITYFDKEATEGIFESEPLKLNDKFYKSTVSEDYGELPEGLQISCRNTEKGFLFGKKNVKEIHNEAKHIMDILQNQ